MTGTMGRWGAVALIGALAATLAGCPKRQTLYVPGPERSADLPADVEALVALADAVEAERGASVARVDRGLAALEKALEAGPEDPYPVLWRLARASARMAESVGPAQQKATYAKQGRTFGAAAVEGRPERVEGHYYLAMCMARVAEASSDMGSLGEMMAVARKAAELDKTYHDAGPLRLMGKTYMVAPAWPTSVGDREEAVEVLKEAVSIAPTGLNRLFFGEALYHAEEHDKAPAQLKRAYADLKREGAEARWIAEAEDYLRRMGEPF